MTASRGEDANKKPALDGAGVGSKNVVPPRGGGEKIFWINYFCMFA
jgi:hypothetical protein